MAAAFLRIESAAPASREGLSGVVRIGATEGLGTIVLAPRLALFARRHPKLVVDLLALPRLLHLSRREADIVMTEAHAEARLIKQQALAEREHLRGEASKIKALLRSALAIVDDDDEHRAEAA